MPSPAMTPLAYSSCQPGLYGVIVDIRKSNGELTNTIEYPRMEPVTPEMSGKPLALVVCPSETTQEPAHDRREIFIPAWLDLQMHVVSHYAKIRNLKTIALLGPREKDEKEIADLASIEEHLASIDSGGDVVPRAFQ
jgi:hypothetical protein